MVGVVEEGLHWRRIDRIFYGEKLGLPIGGIWVQGCKGGA